MQTCSDSTLNLHMHKPIIEYIHACVVPCIYTPGDHEDVRQNGQTVH